MSMGPALAHLGAAVGRKLLRARARLRRGFSLGIAGRLTTSFAAVAVLAIAANVMIGLIKVTNYLLDRQLQRLEQDFLQEGGLRERMTRARLAARSRQGPKPI